MDDSVWDYNPGTPVWSSGQEAHDHGIRDIEDPSEEARKRIDGLIKKLDT
ncbi:hypothetical protein [Phaeobacter phage MD18]|nr:hypothetical protein [Phaeobacter phage MD18]